MDNIDLKYVQLADEGVQFKKAFAFNENAYIVVTFLQAGNAE